MGAVLVNDVHVEVEGGQFVVLKAGDSVPKKYRSLVSNPKAFTEEVAAESSDGDTVGYGSLGLDELKGLLKERELPVSGKKGELVARLEADDAENGDEQGSEGSDGSENDDTEE